MPSRRPVKLQLAPVQERVHVKLLVLAHLLLVLEQRAAAAAAACPLPRRPPLRPPLLLPLRLAHARREVGGRVQRRDLAGQVKCRGRAQAVPMMKRC